MKRKLLLATALVASALGMRAQTDVTSTYITNPGFEGEYQRFMDINTDRGVEKPVGWSVEWYQNNNDKNGMTFVAESMNQDNKTWNATLGKAYFVRMRWGNATLYLRQTLQNLRPGAYKLSFSAVAHTTNTSANSVQVSVAGQSQAITLTSNENGTWANYNINFTVTGSTPYATVELKVDRGGDLLKVGIDEFTLTYDGSSYYNTILTAAQALYDDNADWAENGLDEFRTAITANSGKETIEDKNAAIVALEGAMAAFKAANSVDMTAKITNPNFDSNIDGWTCTGGDGNAFQRQTSAQTNFTGGFLEKWRNGWNGGYNQKNFDVSQELSNLPNGEYTVKAYILAQMQGGKETLGNDYKDKKHGGPYYIDDEKGVWMYATSGSNTINTWANSFTPSFGDTGGGVLRSATVKVENGSLTIGFKGIGSTDGGTQLGTYANWIACDTWTLSYFGFDPTTLNAQISSLKEEAAGLLLNGDYTNVTGTERTDLEGVASITPADEKKATLEGVISTIQGRINAFTGAKANYDAYAEAKGIATTLAATAVTAPTTAAEAVTRAKELYVNIDTKVTSDYTFDATEIYKGDFTGSFSSTTTGQHWSGDTSKSYLDNWGSGNISATRDVTLPAGKYVLKIAGRGAADAVEHKLYMSANGTTVNIPNNGDTGYGIDTNGAVNYSNEGTYANENGRGWEWRFIPVELAAETTITVTLTMERSGGNTWGSFCDFTILMSADNLADDDDYSDLNDAIFDAEEKILGFQNGEYAPYNNVDALTKLSTAQAIDPNVANPKVVVTTALNELEAATWTANTTDVDAIYNGTFAETGTGSNPKGWTRSNNGWGQQITGLTAEANDVNEGTTTAWYYNTNGAWEYGKDGVYTMPLVANQTYMLTFKYRKNGNDWQTWMKASVLKGEEGLKVAQFSGAEDGTKFVTAVAYFTTGAAGDYILSIEQNGNAHLTDVSLVKAASAAFTLSEDADYTPVNRTYYETVTLARTIKADTWNTFVVPFDISNEELKAAFGDGVEVAEFSEEADGLNSTVKFDKMDTPSITANTPVLLKTSTAGTSYEFAGRVLKSGEAKVEGTNFDFVGTYAASTDIAAGDYFISANKLYKSEGATTIAGTRAYLKAKTQSGEVKVRFVIDDETATSIEGIEFTENVENGKIYDISGRLVTRPVKGLYIKNGKKFIVK